MSNHSPDCDVNSLMPCNCGAQSSLAPVAGSAFLDKLENDLRAIKDTASESSAGDPPAGYEELEAGSDALRIADECWHNGLDAMETALRNWIYDQRQHSPNAKPGDAQRSL